MDSPPIPLRFVKSMDCALTSRMIGRHNDEAEVKP